MKNYDVIIVTNNKRVIDNFDNIISVEGSYIDVMTKVRDLVHAGYSLVNHPLPASIRMYYSPIRSIIIKKGGDEKSLITIENSIANYLKTMGKRLPDFKNLLDYEKIDETLFNASLEEYKRIRDSQLAEEIPLK